MRRYHRVVWDLELGFSLEPGVWLLVFCPIVNLSASEGREGKNRVRHGGGCIKLRPPGGVAQNLARLAPVVTPGSGHVGGRPTALQFSGRSRTVHDRTLERRAGGGAKFES